MKFLVIIFLMFSLVSCSSVRELEVVKNDEVTARFPAQDSKSCNELAKSIFMSEGYEKNLATALAEKKLLTFSEKRVQLHYPRLEWINKVKKSLYTSLRNWNNNRYPSFYIFNDEEVIPTAKRYAENLEKILTNQLPIDDDETTKAYIAVTEWKKSFQNYKSEVDQLLEERISIQYNISLLKKLKLEDETRDIQLTIKRAGVLKNEIITLRKEDKNLAFTIKKLKEELKDLDGTMFKNGRIKERIIRQAMLQDMLSISHRELEYVVKNTSETSHELIKELETLSLLTKNTDLAPSTYGVYKASNKIFIREMVATSKLDVVYSKIKDPLVNLKNFAANFFKKRSTESGSEEEKIGIFKRMYIKITSMTPKQAAIGGGTVALAGYGYQRYFWFKPSGAKEVVEDAPSDEMDSGNEAHQQQLEETQKVETQKDEGHSSAVEIHIDELNQ